MVMRLREEGEEEEGGMGDREMTARELKLSAGDLSYISPGVVPESSLGYHPHPFSSTFIWVPAQDIYIFICAATGV